MTMVVSLSEAAQAKADEAIRSGRYTSFGEVVQAALDDDEDSWVDEQVSWDTLSPDDRAAIEAGLADIDAGRTKPADEVFDRLIAKYEALAGRR